MKPKFEFTEDEKEMLSYVFVFAKDLEKSISARWPEPPRWIPVSERLPTEADGMKGSTLEGEKSVLIMWKESGISCRPWNDINSPDILAWFRIPDYAPPVVDKDREEFEAWARREGMNMEFKQMTYLHSLTRLAWVAFLAGKGGLSK